MDANTPDERPNSPPTESENSTTRWIIALFAAALLLLGGYKGYQWWSASAERVQTAPAEAAPDIASMASAASAASQALQPVPVRPAQSSPPPVAEGELQAPAVAGTNIINKCELNGQVTFTNEVCPEGAVAMLAPAEATAVDPNGVSGSTGEKAPVVDRVTLVSEPSEQEAECSYLVAEITRLNYEFQQSLPPPVLDQIATRLKDMRDRSAGLKCVAAPKQESAKPAPSARRAAPAPKMLEEKG